MHSLVTQSVTCLLMLIILAVLILAHRSFEQKTGPSCISTRVYKTRQNNDNNSQAHSLLKTSHAWNCSVSEPYEGKRDLACQEKVLLSIFIGVLTSIGSIDGHGVLMHTLTTSSSPEHHASIKYSAVQKQSKHPRIS